MRSIDCYHIVLLVLLRLSTTAIAQDDTSTCLVGDIMYREGDSIGHIGYECLNETSYEGTASSCGPNGEIIDTNVTMTCPESAGVPYCVQCGPYGWGAALCLSSPEVPTHCEELTEEGPTPIAQHDTSTCLVGDIMYSEGDSIGHIGYECLNETSYEGTASSCGPGGEIIDTNVTITCPESAGVPYCVQCGPSGWGAALCLSSPEVPDHCEGGDAGDVPNEEVTDEVAQHDTSTCLVGDIMYSEGDSIGHIGYECLNDTSYEGRASSCGPGGEIVETNVTMTCPESVGVPYCVQCGPYGWGAALCLGSPEIPDHCEHADADADAAGVQNEEDTAPASTAFGLANKVLSSVALWLIVFFFSSSSS